MSGSEFWEANRVWIAGDLYKKVIKLIQFLNLKVGEFRHRIWIARHICIRIYFVYIEKSYTQTYDTVDQKLEETLIGHLNQPPVWSFLK